MATTAMHGATRPSISPDCLAQSIFQSIQPYLEEAIHTSVCKALAESSRDGVQHVEGADSKQDVADGNPQQHMQAQLKQVLCHEKHLTSRVEELLQVEKALRNQVEELSAFVVKIKDAIDVPSTTGVSSATGEAASEMVKKGAEAQYNEAFQNIGGDDALSSCKLISMQIAAVIHESLERGQSPWVQDAIYQGLEPKLLLRDAGAVQGTFACVCNDLAMILRSKGLDVQVLIAPLKGIVRSTTKVNVKYAGDVCQLSDIARATLQITAVGKQTLLLTYTALYQMVLSPPTNIQFMHFDDRYIRKMFGGYRDFLFLVRIRGILCEVQVNFDSMLMVKDGDGHAEYEVERLNNDLMLAAAQENDASAVKQHLQKGAKPNYVTALGFSALTYAALHGNACMARVLLDHNADPFQVDSTGSLAASRGVMLGRFEAAKSIMIEMQSRCLDMSRPLSLTQHAKLDVIKVWAQLKSDESFSQAGEQSAIGELFTKIFERVSGGYDAALRVAAQAGLAATCTVLLKYGARKDTYFTTYLQNKFAPMDFAIHSGSVSTVRALLEQRANMARYCQEHYRNTLEERALRTGDASQLEALLLLMQGCDDHWVELLSKAAERSSMNIARALLRNGVSAAGLSTAWVARLAMAAVLRSDVETLILLHARGASFEQCGAALRVAAKSGLEEIVSSLASFGCPLEEVNDEEDAQLVGVTGIRMNAMHWAACFGHVKILQILCNLKCDIDAEAYDDSRKLLRGATVMNIAASFGHSEMLKVLASMRCDLNTPKALHTPLLDATYSSESETARWLVLMRCDLERREEWGFGRTAVLAAAHGGRLDVLRTLGKARADLNAQCRAVLNADSFRKSKNGYTCAHFSAAHDKVEFIKTLAQLRADLSLQDAQGKRAIDLAPEGGKVRSLLKELMSRDA